MDPLPCPYDICQCGDYRHQHSGPENRGSCVVCRNGDPATDYETSCQRYRNHSHTEHPEVRR